MNQCEGCKLCNLGITHKVCIPPPSEKIRGCLISRDPTFAFLVELNKYKRLPADQKGILWFKEAPPSWLYNKIRVFMNSPENSRDMNKLQHFLKNQCYWTHLHKCPTCKSGKNHDQNQKGMGDLKEYFPPFRYSTAKSCANRWFEFEFNKYGLNDKIIITLRRDVEKFFKQSSKQLLGENGNKVISLPHPSGANCGNGWSWNKNTVHKDHITEEINRLLQLI